MRDQAKELGIGGHCLLPALTDPLVIARAVETVRTTIREADLRRVCAEAGLLDVGITQAEARELAEILDQRRKDLGDLVTANRPAFVGVPAGAWPLVI